MTLRLVLRALLGLLPAMLLGCPSTSPSDEGGTTGASADSTGDDGDDAQQGGELLGCPHGACVMLLATQALDDRVEIFVPDHPDSAYRGTIDLDLEPNTCSGCGPGDIGEERLDEPFGLARAGGFLHVLMGHYPSRAEGSLMSMPLSLFEGRPGGSTVPVGDLFADGQFLDPVIGRSLATTEPIFIHEHASGRLVIGVFDNDLFASEDTWTNPGSLIVFDPTDPGGDMGMVTLDGLAGGACQGVGQIVDLGGDVLAVACDGNEAVALLDGSGVGAGTVAEAATGLGTGTLCPVPGAIPGRRVRHLAPDGSGGFLVGEGPTPLDLLGGASLWHMGPDCGLIGTVNLPTDSDWQLGQIVRVPAGVPVWLFAAGSASADGARGVFVAHEASGALEQCGPVAGFDAHWDDGHGGTLEPFALAITSDGTSLAVGAGPFVPSNDAVGYGKVLWASLSGADPCSLTADVVDLTDGAPGHAPAPVEDDPTTFRRGPNVMTIVELD